MRGARASPERADIGAAIAALIAAEGPIPVERYMALANVHYYATQPAIGAEGDFVTAPEISQMFGELVGLALADLWQRAGRPEAAYVELGPGRGTLAADALRAMRRAGLMPPVHLVETSDRLRDEQHARLPDAIWHGTIDGLPRDQPLLVVANEFFDALPVRQLVRTVSGWRERLIDLRDGAFVAVPGSDPVDDEVPPHLLDADPGGIVETRPLAASIARELGERLAQQGGVLLAIDYGHDGRRHGDTLQAVRAHAYADPLARPGASDLTAHVDFGALAAAGAAGCARVAGPVEQGQWLTALGISDRAAALARSSPPHADAVAAAHRRLVHPDEMGRLFKVVALVAPAWPSPAGFG